MAYKYAIKEEPAGELVVAASSVEYLTRNITTGTSAYVAVLTNNSDMNIKLYRRDLLYDTTPVWKV